jgi:hypothetical protein
MAKEPGKHNGSIRSVAIVEREAKDRIARHQLEHFVKLVDGQPVVTLLRLQLPSGNADPMEAEVDDP